MKVDRFNFVLAFLVFTSLLNGCSREAEQIMEKPAPVHIESGDECHLCGMVITRFPGPKGEAITEKEQTTYKFCSTKDLFSWILQPENSKRKFTVYVHDMSETEWNSPLDTSLIDAREAFYVIGSRRKGAMGPTLASFATKTAAHAFMKEYGGEILKYDDITLELLNTAISMGKMSPE